MLALSKADTALSELSGLGRNLPNPHLLIAPYIGREAVLSSRIEGTRASLSDVLLDEVDEDPARRQNADVKEIRNYIAALEHGLSMLEDGYPLSLWLVRELHGRLMGGVRGETAKPGEFRDGQNLIGSKGDTEVTASYVPPPPQHMAEALRDWERFLQERDKMPDLIQCALMHEQFEAIHPFWDGNGRVGRLLITLFLLERGRLSQPLLYLSAFIEAHRRDYYDLLQRVRTHCDWASWLRFFLTGVVETAQTAIEQSRQILDLREEFLTRLRGKPRALALLDELFNNPYMTVNRAQHILGSSKETARQAVAALGDNGMLTEITGRAWRRVYLAAPIMEVIEPEEVTV